MDIVEQIALARKSLLDLTMRNRLLNFRPNKARSICVIDEVPSEVYEILVLNEKTMRFKPAPPQDAQISISEESESAVDKVSGVEEENLSQLWKLSPPESPPDRYIDSLLQTQLEEETLQKRLFYITQQARSVFEEQGYSVLFLALGFLEWRESPDAIDTRKAPLILVPVRLERKGVQNVFRLTWTEEDVFPNLSLIEKLKDLGIVLPDFQMPDEKSGIERYFNSIQALIESKKGWHVLSDIYLDFFSFTKFVMYKDLDPALWPSLFEHPLLGKVLDPKPDTSTHDVITPEEMDRKLAMKDLYHIMDADPYQVAVLEEVKAGSDLVVEGPPGTGKSQTIANSIAELLALGKKVLFVSEKMAALEVVKERLDLAELGLFCLEIHSRKASKKDVLKELERSFRIESSPMQDGDGIFDEAEDLRKQLNDYARALRESVGKSGKSPFSLIAIRERACRNMWAVGRSMPRADLGDLTNIDGAHFAQTKVLLRELHEIAQAVHPINEHPWYGTNPGLIMPGDEVEIGGEVGDLIPVAEHVGVDVNQLAEALGLTRQNTPTLIQAMLSAASVILEGPQVANHVLENEKWNRKSPVALGLIDQLTDCLSAVSNIQLQFHSTAIEENIESLLSELRERRKSLFRIVSVKWWRLLLTIRRLYKGPSSWKSSILVADLERLTEVIKKRGALRSKADLGKEFFGAMWKAEKSDPKSLQAFSDWIVNFRACVKKGLISEFAYQLLSGTTPEQRSRDKMKRVLANLDDFFVKRDALFSRLKLDPVTCFGVAVEDLDFDKLRAKFGQMDVSGGSLHRWSQYAGFREKARSTIARPVVELLEKGAVSPEELVDCFESNVADGLLRIAFAERPILASFIGDVHEKKIVRFQELDEEIILENRTRLMRFMLESRPTLLQEASRGSELGILQGEFGRKRGHMPIRKLMTNCGNLIQSLKPCFMMSPLSVAQFLAPGSIQFDVIIFDEASQVRPEDALGALVRGNQLVVMGDTKQLPPTTFFDSVVAGEVAEDEDSVEAGVSEVESILHQCKRAFLTKLLGWHYRSKHESLIAVSNREFYDNRLRTFPSATDISDDLGLSFVYLPNTVYDRGRSSVNREEAREVAKAAVLHYRQHPDMSLGIGAFNIRQQQVILEEIEIQILANPDLEEFFHSDRQKHFFVKNLETIQGDERDVIFVSVGFGFDENRKLSLNFGPLSHAGGERRLNVLMTRAREKCVVFANFRATDLQLDSNSPFGVRALRQFLQFAEDRSFVVENVPGVDADSPFEESVAGFLKDNGYQVRKQVGCASFRIDLGIIDSRRPGSYLAGVECDGEKYHTTPVARDRDRLRQQVLEGLGWRIIRIWSTDWYRSRADAGQRLLKSLERTKAEARLSRLKVRRSPAPSPKNEDPVQQKSVNDQSIPSTNGLTVISEVAPLYVKCSSLGIPVSEELHRQPSSRLSTAVISVVEIESPVHQDEAKRRIRALWGLARTGGRISEALNNGIRYALKSGRIRRKGEFLFIANDRPIRPRRREDDPPPNLDFICDDEITAAIMEVLDLQFSTQVEPLIVQTCRIFGIQVTHDDSATRVGKIITRLIDGGGLQKLSNGMVARSTLGNQA